MFAFPNHDKFIGTSPKAMKFIAFKFKPIHTHPVLEVPNTIIKVVVLCAIALGNAFAFWMNLVFANAITCSLTGAACRTKAATWIIHRTGDCRKGILGEC